MAATIHTMIDIETLGTRPGCAILSIGAVRFNPNTMQILDRFYCNVDAAESFQRGFDFDEKTVEWWDKQLPEIKARLNENQVTVDVAMQRLAKFLLNEAGQIERYHSVWCQGGSFDFPILTWAYEALQMPMPWHFWQERDSRTLLQVMRETLGFELRKLESGAHDALADATHQAKEVMRALRYLRAM